MSEGLSAVDRRRAALHSLHGLAIGDGLGERFFWPEWGDVDTTCAIAGGVVAARVGVTGIPAEWRARAEPLPDGFAAA